MKKLIAGLVLALGLTGVSHGATYLGTDDQPVSNVPGTQLLIGTTQQISVDATGSTVTVDANQLDIDDLNSTDDKVGVEGLTDGTDALDINADGSIDVNFAAGASVTVSTGTITVHADQLDVDDLTFASDKVDASGSTLGANDGVDIGDVSVNNEVDIRDLTHVSDSIKIGDGTETANVDANNNLNVIDASRPSLDGKAMVFERCEDMAAAGTCSLTGLGDELELLAYTNECVFTYKTKTVTMRKNTSQVIKINYTETNPTVTLTSKVAGAECTAQLSGAN